MSFVAFFLWGFLTYSFISNNEGVIYSVVIGANVNLNSPFLITIGLLGMSVLAVFFIPPFVANAIAKDEDNNFDPILYSAPVSKQAYLLGRFIGAFVALMIVMTGAPLGMLLSEYLLTLDFAGTDLGVLLADIGLLLDPEAFGPTRMLDYFVIYFLYLVPLMLSLSLLIFAIAIVSNRAIYPYLAIIGLLMLFMSGNGLGVDGRTLQALLDPFMLDAFIEQSQYWTSSERNISHVSYSGIVLQNRLIWLAVATVSTLLAFSLFSFQSVNARGRANLLQKVRVVLASSPKNGRQLGPTTKDESRENLKVTPVQGAAVAYRQLLWRTKFECMSVLKGLPFLIILTFSAFSLFGALIDRGSNFYGSNIYPLTRVMVEAIGGNLDLIIILVVVVFSADIIWRERNSKFNEIIDALPVESWIFVVSKLLALVLILSSILLLSIVLALSVQISNGYENLELGLYFERGYFFLITQPIFIAVLACFVHVLVQSRFLGIAIMVLYLLSFVIFQVLGLDHPLSHYGLSDFRAPLSDMNGSGRFMLAGYWLRLYWLSIAVILLLLTHLLWNRGTAQPLRLRLKNLRVHKNSIFAIPILIATMCAVSTGSFIFYNTNILNEFVTPAKVETFQLAYEMRYRQYENLPMPRVVDVKTAIDIYPEERRVETRSLELLKNKTSREIAAIHLSFPIDVDVVKVEIQDAQLSSFDSELQYAILELDRPMRPGETRSLSYETVIQEKGFSYNQSNASFGRTGVNLARNGTLLGNLQISPYIGFSPNRMIADSGIRQKYNLEPVERREKLENVRRGRITNLRQDRDFINFEATISTTEKQIAVSIGKLEQEWVEGGRHYFTYKTSARSRGSYPVLSAEYEVVREEFNGVDIEVYYHESHAYNIDRMVESVKDSINYYTEAFGPYQFEHLRIVETPVYHGSATAFSGTITYSAHLGFITQTPGDGGIDVPYYVTAHEVAHQWWAGQIFTANTQGDAMLSETLAQYGALLMMERKYGEHQVRKFLKWELDRYLAGRGNDPKGELPLNRVEGGDYIHTHKGAVNMYALRDYVGEDVVNRSLQRFLELRSYSVEPFAISTDFLDILKEEAGPENHKLIEDLFEKITLFDLELKDVQVEETLDGRFKVRLEIEVAKLYADATGLEIEADMDMSVDIGLFFASPTHRKFSSDDVIYMSKVPVVSGSSTIEIYTDQMPTVAGIDPYSKLIDRDSNDNILTIQ
jgi:hypothetical protein